MPFYRRHCHCPNPPRVIKFDVFWEYESRIQIVLIRNICIVYNLCIRPHVLCYRIYNFIEDGLFKQPAPTPNYERMECISYVFHMEPE